MNGAKNHLVIMTMLNLFRNFCKRSNLAYVVIILALVSVLGCSKNPEVYIQHIEGYWEIEKVTLSNGFEKNYKYNETIDYISINDSLKGFRKKMTPGINDTYFTTDDAEAITLKIENNALNIYYTTPYANWKETVLEATPKNLKIINENKDVYLYKRYTPINLDIEN
jgi:hypothetical protein